MANLLAGHPAEDHARLAFSKLRFYPVGLKDDLRERGLWDDLAQELYRIALDGWRSGRTPKEMGGMATREIRAFLKAYGYVRHQGDGDGFIKPETAFSRIGTGDKEDEWERLLAGARALPASYDIPESLDDAVLAVLRDHSEGLSQEALSRKLRYRNPALLLSECCARLVMRGVVREIPRQRQGSTGMMPGPLLALQPEALTVS
jgi:hypothetical protein